MHNKQKMRNRLGEDELYRRAVMSATENDRKMIEGTVEPAFASIMDDMCDFFDKVVNDKEAFLRLIRGLNGDTGLVNDESALKSDK